ncbi:MAG: ribonuclease III [candidate division KSB1 bacterium]|nr:ribonuclease III [candidate division KSB1 bacterium]
MNRLFSRLVERLGLYRRPHKNWKDLEKRLGYRFKNKELLHQALKHRSYLVQSGEHRNASNERLEFLGDAVLGFLITDYLYREYPDEAEGTLTNYKSLLVSGTTLSEFASELKLGDFILLNDAESRSGGRTRTSILSDAFESLIGALYLDGGLEEARKFVLNRIAGRLDSLLEEGKLRNSKSLLQELAQHSNWSGPFYQVEEESGPDHQKIYTVSVTVNGRKMGIGKGSSKKRAEQNAAAEALRRLNIS